MKRSLIIGALTLLTVACGAGESKLDVKLGSKDAAFAIKSSGSDMSVKTFTDIAGKITTASSFYAVMASYDMDTKNVATMKKPLTAADQVRMTLQLIGEEGTDQNSALKTGIYKADPKEKFMKVDSLTITTFVDGKEAVTTFDTMFSGSKITGQVEVTSITADAISGKIDVTEGDKSVKGAFSAKVAPKK